MTAQDSGLTVPAIIDRICIGGWPALLDAGTQDAGRWLRDYLNQIVLVDIQELGVRRRDPENIRRLLNSLARNVGTAAKVTALAKDVGGAEGPVARATVDGYLDSLSRLRLTENSPAWAPHMRSATPLQSSPTRYFVDPSLAVAALGQGPTQLLGDLNATGFFFENLVVRDVRIYAQKLGGQVHHWRDQNQNEVDVVVTLPDGRWGAFEVKIEPGRLTSITPMVVAIFFFFFFFFCGADSMFWITSEPGGRKTHELNRGRADDRSIAGSSNGEHSYRSGARTGQDLTRAGLSSDGHSADHGKKRSRANPNLRPARSPGPPFPHLRIVQRITGFPRRPCRMRAGPLTWARSTPDPTRRLYRLGLTGPGIMREQREDGLMEHQAVYEAHTGADPDHSCGRSGAQRWHAAS